MDFIKGGRGKRAPYQTCTVRIPADLKDRVEKMSENFRSSLDNQVPENSGISQDLNRQQAANLMKQIIKLKKQKKGISIEQLEKVLQLLVEEE